ncbi:MAG: 3-dehydroquinate synthase [Phycisphaeraceae bacterium]|nr:3-dehydroquinate synthase [Phycisphaeraceae bacterium]
MPSVELKLPHHRYEICVEPGLLGTLGERVKQVAGHERAMLIADAAVAGTLGQKAIRALEAGGYRVVMQAVEAGEENKNLVVVSRLYQTMVENRLERKSPVIALGGGIIGDMAGFVAATYLRGVPFVQCPTTLLAMVDASVGGKVGVNLPQGKNLVGAFHQPRLVAIDTESLGTLPKRELRCGLAECVKHGVIRDAELFAWIEKNLAAILGLDKAALVELVRWNVAIKAAVVMADEKEAGERAHLNFGHTFAHAIEAAQEYGAPSGYHHGEAVALGMVAATRLAVAAGRCPAEVLKRLMGLLERIGLPTRGEALPETEELIGYMQVDKKVSGGKIRLVLPERMGAVSVVSDVGLGAIAEAWEGLR